MLVCACWISLQSSVPARADDAVMWGLRFSSKPDMRVILRASDNDVSVVKLLSLALTLECHFFHLNCSDINFKVSV